MSCWNPSYASICDACLYLNNTSSIPYIYHSTPSKTVSILEIEAAFFEGRVQKAASIAERCTSVSKRPWALVVASAARE